MNYLVVKDGNGPIENRIVGYHEKKKVTSQFYYSVLNAEPNTKYRLVKCKTKVLEKIPGYWDFYLIRHGCNYIPAKYYDMVRDDIDTMICEYKFTIEILERIIEFDKISKGDRETLKDAIMVLTEEIQLDLDECLSPTELQRREEMYSQFKYAVYESCKKSISNDEWIPFV